MNGCLLPADRRRQNIERHIKGAGNGICCAGSLCYRIGKVVASGLRMVVRLLSRQWGHSER
nr:hypothetical protein [Escherichia coli]